eukprot:13711147-Ditylum_brightwellii.AAC.1
MEPSMQRKVHSSTRTTSSANRNHVRIFDVVSPAGVLSTKIQVPGWPGGTSKELGMNIDADSVEAEH